MSDDKDDILSGRFRAYLNLKKQPGDKRPAFQGHATLPGDHAERPIALWAYTTQKGKSVLMGRAGVPGATATDQIAYLSQAPREPDPAEPVPAPDAKTIDIEPYEVKLFVNAAKAEHDKRPDYWGYYHPGEGARLMRLSIWAEKDQAGRAMLRGNVDAYVPRKEREKESEPPVQKRRTRDRSR